MPQTPPSHRSDTDIKAATARFKDDIWGKLTEIKVPHLHAQHCRLVEYLITVYEMMEKFKGGRVTEDDASNLDLTLANIQDYVIHHLVDEEEFLERIAFPETDKHKLSHTRFKNKFTQLGERMQGGELQYVNDLFFFIYSWLFEHINSQDTRYSEFYVQMPLAKDFPSKDYLLDTIMKSAVDGIIIINDQGIILQFNRAAEQLFGYDASEVIGKNISALMPAPHSAEHDSHIASYMTTQEPHIIGSSREVIGLKNDGTTFPMQLSVSVFQGEGATYFTGILHDITQQKKHEAEILRSRDLLEERVRERTRELETINFELKDKIAANERAQAELELAAKVFDNAGEAILITDTNANIISVNQAYLDITGHAYDDVIGQNPRIGKSGRHDQEFYREMWQTLLVTGKWRGEIWDCRKDGEQYPKLLTITAVKNSDGDVKNYVGIFSDISMAKENERKLEELAYYDTLTKLPNRKLFNIRLDHDLETAKRSKRFLAVLFIDLDKFKKVNDTLGHAAGDELLVQVAKRLNDTVRAADTVARIGGDEFTVILANVEKEENVAQISKNIIYKLQQPFDIAGKEASIGASIGIGMFPQDGSNSEELLKNADIAMYQAKNCGRGVYKFFMPAMNALTQHFLQMENNMKKAIIAEQFKVFYQPKVDHSQNRIIGMEALVRWEHPEHGLVPPNEFIPLAEDTNLIIPIGVQVLKIACRDTVLWKSSFSDSLKVAVNISARQLQQASELIATIKNTLIETQLSPENIELEITESMLMENVDETIETLKKFRDMGISIAMDDFGTGYSSLSYLKKLPIKTLKIDRAFIKDIPHSEDDVAIVSTIISLAQNLKMDLVAEGIENQEQIKFLQERGCHVIQGYFYSPPLPSTKFDQYLKGWKLI